MDQALRILSGGWAGGLAAISPLTRGYYATAPSAALTADVAGAGYIYGLRQVRLVSEDGLITGLLPAAQTLSWSERLATGELKDHRGLARVDTVIEGIEWSLEAGGISLQAYSLLLAASVETSGLSPNREQRVNRRRGDAMPYVKIYGRSLGDANDGLHVLLKRCKVTSLEGSLGNQEFLLTECSGVGVADATGSLYEVVKVETDKALPVV